MKSIMGGLCIGLGCLIYCSVADHMLGALLFSCGLLAIRLMKYDLFTGKIQFIVTKKYNKNYYIFCLLGNLLGIIIAMCPILFNKELLESAAAIGNARIIQPYSAAIINGIGCGALMTIATYEKTPLWVSSLCVVGFISAGFNHCIADWFYLLATANSTPIIKILLSWIPILSGNLIGGMIVSPYLLNT